MLDLGVDAGSRFLPINDENLMNTHDHLFTDDSYVWTPSQHVYDHNPRNTGVTSQVHDCFTFANVSHPSLSRKPFSDLRVSTPRRRSMFADSSTKTHASAQCSSGKVVDQILNDLDRLTLVQNHSLTDRIRTRDDKNRVLSVSGPGGRVFNRTGKWVHIALELDIWEKKYVLFLYFYF